MIRLSPNTDLGINSNFLQVILITLESFLMILLQDKQTD